uniref:hypothetical protein n=1 Tax=Lelliottia wanjuensis TaxID=3050585 RepID=UPI00254BA6B3|nr:hypothetical protein [Lelliottia sp. V89_5]
MEIYSPYESVNYIHSYGLLFAAAVWLLHFKLLKLNGEGEGNEDTTVDYPDYFLDWLTGGNGRV